MLQSKEVAKDTCILALASLAHSLLWGVDMGSKAYKIKVGYVTLTRNEAGKFKVRYRIPSTNQDVRQWLRVLSLQDAKEAAEKINRELLTGKGTFAGKKTVVSIQEALEQSIKSTKGNSETLERYERGAEAFQSFVKIAFPQIRVWSELRPSMIEQWVKSMIEQGKAFDSIRLAMVPIRRASSYWFAEEPELYRDFVKVAGMRLTVSKPPAKPIHVLNSAQLMDFIDWLKIHSPNLHPLACLCGLAGLRIREALYLRHCDISFENRTVTVTDTPWHKPKNRGSYRTIPIHTFILDVVKEHIESQRIQGMNESPIFLTRYKGPWTHYGIVSAWRETLKKAEATIPRAKGFQAHRLRASFATILMQAGCNERMLKLYIGHVAPDVLGEHYLATSIEDQRHSILQTLDSVLMATNERTGRFLAQS